MTLPVIQPQSDLSFQHLQAELARLDILLQRQVLRWQSAGQDPGDAFRGLYISDAEASALLNRPFASNWGQGGALSAEEETWFQEVSQRAAQASQRIQELAQAQGAQLRLSALGEIFSLEPFDLDVLLICLAPTLDLRYERLYGYLQDDVTRKRPTVNLVLDLLCPPGPPRLLQLPRFSVDAPLFRNRLLEKSSGSGGGSPPLLGQNLAVDESVVSWLLGHYQPHAELLPIVQLQTAPKPTIAELVEAQLRPAMQSQPSTQPPAELTPAKMPLAELAPANLTPVAPPVLILYGPDQAGQDTAAQFIAASLERHLLTVHLNKVEPGESHGAVEVLGLEQVVRLALRDARLAGAVPYLRGWDACLEDGVPPAGVLAELFAFPGMAVISSRSAWRAAGMDRQRSLSWVEFAIPSYTERRALWLHFLRSLGIDETAADITSLAGQFQLTQGQIRDAVHAARDWAIQSGSPVTNAGLFAAARLYSNPRLSSLARKLQPRYGWEDIVLPADQRTLLKEIVNTVRQRPRVLDEWGVGLKLASSRGVTVLFAGPPGTGKTMAAEVISGELGLDLYKIDLSTVISKYIGETEKNLEKIFNEAETSNAILFFDEADSLFGKRSEVRDSHDRYANIEISYLLQRMEAYDGVTILATNLRANLDEAFTRRLQFAVDFPFPEEVDRLRIWKTLFPPDVPCGEDVDLSLLARRFKLAGGNIRNIIVNAAYLAAADGGMVTMNHLLHGTRRELQKMGRLVSEGDMLPE
jgi:hypothetical protein